MDGRSVILIATGGMVERLTMFGGGAGCFSRVAGGMVEPLGRFGGVGGNSLFSLFFFHWSKVTQRFHHST